MCKVFRTIRNCAGNPSVWPFRWKQFSSTFMWFCLLCCTRRFSELLSLWMCVTIQIKATAWTVFMCMVLIIMLELFIMLYKEVLTFKSVDETFVCDHSNESCWAELSCGAVFNAMYGDFYSNLISRHSDWSY